MKRAILIAFVGLSASSAGAQQPTPDATAAQPTTDARPASMEEPLPGDRWTWDLRDEITGKALEPREEVVTEVSPTEMSIRFSIIGTQRGGLRIFDRSWNLKTNSPWSFAPNDGLGIKAPLSVGASWTFKGEQRNSANNGFFKRTGSSKVVAKETVTTKAGTFDTFKIETTYSARPSNPTGVVDEYTIETWYAPAIDHWVKRVVTGRSDKHLRSQETLELTDYGRKKSSS